MNKVQHLRNAIERFRKDVQWLEDHPGQIRQQDIDERDSAQKALSYIVLDNCVPMLDELEALRSERDAVRREAIEECAAIADAGEQESKNERSYGAALKIATVARAIRSRTPQKGTDNDAQ